MTGAPVRMRRAADSRSSALGTRWCELGLRAGRREPEVVSVHRSGEHECLEGRSLARWSVEAPAHQSLTPQSHHRVKARKIPEMPIISGRPSGRHGSERHLELQVPLLAAGRHLGPCVRRPRRTSLTKRHRLAPADHARPDNSGCRARRIPAVCVRQSDQCRVTKTFPAVTGMSDRQPGSGGSTIFIPAVGFAVGPNPRRWYSEVVFARKGSRANYASTRCCAYA